MITPRVTRLLRVRDLRALQRAIASAIPCGLDARATAVVVPTASAAAALRRTLEEHALGEPNTAWVVPQLVTRGDLYRRLHESTPDLPPMLTGFERDVIFRLAAEDADREGARPPFRLRPGLVSAILGFYDDLRRRLRTIDSFDRHVRGRLEAGRGTDRGAERLLEQTEFLAAAFAAFERRTADSGRLDEHGLRALVLSGDVESPFRRIVVAVPDDTCDSRGLWPCDFDLLSRMRGLERIDLVSTERMLSTGLHQRLHDALPGLEEVRADGDGNGPVLIAPPADPGGDATLHFISRDREEELSDAAGWIKARARSSGADLGRTAIVFVRPLPYLYLARQVLASAGIPYQAHDALPLAAEPFSAALDLVLTLVAEEPSRTSVVDLLVSPLWRFRSPRDPERSIQRHHVSALDRILQESKYLGGWDALRAIAARAADAAAGSTREAGRWRRAAPALEAAAEAGTALERVRSAGTASRQLAALLEFVTTCERLPAEHEGDHDRHMRARAAALGALAALRDARARYDDRPVPPEELVSTLRRWLEAQTFSPRTGETGVLLVDAHAAAFATAEAARLVGVVEPDWPERAAPVIFYPASLLRELGWPADADRLAAARARFGDLLRLPSAEVSVSAFALEEDALVPPSPFLEELGLSELTVRRDERRPFTRIFVHEALTIEPVRPHVLEGPAARWLELRSSRTDAGCHGRTGSRAPEVYAVSRVERYLECPFKYFAASVLQLEEEKEDESGLTPQERGQLLHGVFETFFTAWKERGRTEIAPSLLDDAVALFEEVAEAHLAGLPEADRALERNYLLGSAAAPGLAERAFAVEIEQGVPVIERLLEHQFEGTFRFQGREGPRDVQVRGKADRIDLLADGTIRIVDYKLGRAPKPVRALQLPVYGVCTVQDLERTRGRHMPLARAGYIAFREKGAFVDLAGRSGDLESALREGQARFVDAVSSIEAGEFAVAPDEPWLCNRCGYSHVCRKDYVGDE